MRKFTFIFLFTSVISISSAIAQITVNESDVTNFYSVGNTYTAFSKSMTAVDIGSPGGGNTWDFSAFVADSSTTYSTVDPAGTPFASNFSEANSCQYFSSVHNDTTFETYSYSKIGSGNMEMYGNGILASLAGNSQQFKVITAYSPPQLSIQFPITSGSMWSSADTMTMSAELYGNMMIMSTSNVEMKDTVDAYGTIKLPGGNMVDALRIRQEHTIYSTLLYPAGSTTRTKTVNYTFVTKSGESFSVSSPDTVTMSGSISGELSWIMAGNSTGIAARPASFDELSLAQNEPNPFNQQTTLRYNIPTQGEVSLTIYDLAGREIRTLVKANQAAGAYQIVWDGRNDIGNRVKAGFYISRLESASGTRNIKMSLLK